MKTENKTLLSARATFWLYNALLLFVIPLLLCYTVWRRFGQKKSSASFAGQWGFVPNAVIETLHTDTSTPVIWIHAVSVGETIAARPIARALKEALPSCRIALSCTTDTGFQTAQDALNKGEVEATFYFPLDIPLAVIRALNAVRPDAFLAVETELWPNFLHIARERAVLCMLVNGRVSDKLLESAPRWKWLWRWMLSNLDTLLMRSDFDADRMRNICERIDAPESADKVLVPGDVKLDNLADAAESAVLRQKWREILKIEDGELLWVCGSTHPGEEVLALQVFASLQQDFPQLRLLLAPRHIERTAEVLALCEQKKMRSVRRGQIDADNKAGVLILDTVGELAEIYAAADIAFVGGSLIPRGGHNVLEPVLRGVPVLFGPHVANFKEAASLVRVGTLGQQVDDASGLLRALEFWLRHDDERAAIASRAHAALSPHQGASERIAEEVAKRLKSKTQKPSAKRN